ncbi:hypothetical protein AWU82_28435 [Pseudomonas glycinae]|uniref:Uncharacterized protein n=1 Tax=Pseudomonas glycinae TaxID=1785145 RepID=A0ABM6QHI8_9PSED|nr:hypothetical protein AWU82_28435 [Pseudomonas glycinae]
MLTIFELKCSELAGSYQYYPFLKVIGSTCLTWERIMPTSNVGHGVALAVIFGDRGLVGIVIDFVSVLAFFVSDRFFSILTCRTTIFSYGASYAMGQCRIADCEGSSD